MDYINWIRNRRKQLKLSQMELSDISGVSTAFIKKIEEGVTNPSIGTLCKLLDAMGMELVCKEKEPELSLNSKEAML